MKKYINYTILILAILLITGGVALQMWKKHGKSSVSLDTTQIVSTVINYQCVKDTGWVNFNKTDLNGYDLGNYRRTEKFIFSIIDDKNLMDPSYSIQLEFENIDGYSYLAIDENGGFVENFDEKNLLKTYSSDKILPKEFISNEANNNTKKYLNQLNELGFICEER